MSRTLLALLGLYWICGCSTMTAFRSEEPCDDCLPPKVAGRVYNRTCDNILTSFTAQNCARRDLKSLRDTCDSLTLDFRQGYTQAYIDLAVGRPACVPAVPPEKYWHAWHRSCAGSEAVEEWYAGYRTGLDYGVNGGVSRFNRIVIPEEGCCVSAKYVNPYSPPQTPSGVMPANRQTISRRGAPAQPPENQPETESIQTASGSYPAPVSSATVGSRGY